MEKEFVTYEQALALKELGFDEPCFGYYDEGGNLYTEMVEVLKAPLYQQAFRWFREKHKLHSWVQPMYEDQNFYVFVLARPNDFMIPKDINWEGDEYLNHEEAENACIDMLIEIIKNKKDEKDNTDNNNNNNRLHL
jgi:hypothetical protein